MNPKRTIQIVIALLAGTVILAAIIAGSGSGVAAQQEAEPLRWLTYADNDPRLIYADGIWSQVSDVASAEGGTVTVTQETNATLTVPFEGWRNDSY